MNGTEHSVRRIRVGGRAARFLAMLRDFGHLDDEGLDEVLVALTDLAPDERETEIDLARVRRVAAGVLFGEDGEALEEPGMLGEDWPLLFS